MIFILRSIIVDLHINNCENRASLPKLWLSKHRGISKDRPQTYLKNIQKHTEN